MGSSRNRRQREDQRRGRRERRRRAGMASLLHVPDDIKIVRPPADVPKISDTLVAFAQPLLDDLDHSDGLRVYQSTLLFASAIWNLLVALDAEYKESGPVKIPEERLLGILDDLGAATGMPEDLTFEILQLLAKRKHDLFPDDDRLILDVGTEFRGSRVHVVAAYGMPRPAEISSQEP